MRAHPQPGMVRVATEAMATRFEVAIWDDRSEAQVRAIGEAAIEEIQGWHRRLNLFDAASLCGYIARLEPGGRVRLAADEIVLLGACLEWRRISNGVFDIAASGARKMTGRQANQAGAGEMEAGSADISIDESRSELVVGRSGVLLDFGGVAKGFALDRVQSLMREEGVACGFAHGGTSSVMTIGVPRDERGGGAWKVQVGAARVELDGAGRGHLSVSKDAEGLLHAVVHGSGLRAEGWSTLLAVSGADNRVDVRRMIERDGGVVVVVEP